MAATMGESRTRRWRWGYRVYEQAERRVDERGGSAAASCTSSSGRAAAGRHRRMLSSQAHRQ